MSDLILDFSRSNAVLHLLQPVQSKSKVYIIIDKQFWLYSISRCLYLLPQFFALYTFVVTQFTLKVTFTNL